MLGFFSDPAMVAVLLDLFAGIVAENPDVVGTAVIAADLAAVVVVATAAVVTAVAVVVAAAAALVVAAVVFGFVDFGFVLSFVQPSMQLHP